LDAVDKKLADLKSPFAIENRLGDSVRPDKVVFVPRNATMMEALESLPKESAATWYPWAKNIIITTKEDRTRAMLGRTMTIRYSGTDVLQVLMDLSARSGVRFEIQSGAIAQLPSESRRMTGVFENAPVQQILEAVTGSTGLAWTIHDRTVQISNANAAGAGPAREPIIGMLQLDNGLQVFVRASEVPADVREYVKFKTAKEMEKMRQRMQEEGFKPTTQPAPTTAPTNENL
jgi:hypothetical protein